MKYSEFEKRITERLGFGVENEKSYIDVIKSNYLVGRVSKEYRYNFTIRTAGSSLTDDKARYLAQMCHELACTTLETREEEKKYRLRFSGFSNNPAVYISKGNLTGILQLQELGHPLSIYEFTKKEIESFPDKVREHAHTCEWEEVE